MDLSIPAEWNRIEPVREAVARWVLATVGDEEITDALSMVCTELLGNAVKYGKPDGVQLSIVRRNGEIEIAIVNEVSVDSAHLTRLQQQLEWMKGFPDPTAAYLAAMAKVSEDDSADGGLGLVRVEYEGGCKLSAHVRDGQITMRARRPVGANGA
jgi:hypothetical protein